MSQDSPPPIVPAPALTPPTRRAGSKWSEYWGIPENRVSVATLILLALTFGATAYQAHIFREQEKNELTAFLTVNDLLVRPIKDDAGKIVQIEYSPVVENSGVTAARNATMSGGISLWTGADNKNAPDLPTGDAHSGGPLHLSIGPRSKQDALRGATTVTSGMVILLQKRQAAAYIFGRIDYSDIFENKHLTQYCFLVGKKNAENIPDEIPVQFCGGKTNCIDDECSAQ